ncbi:hypothetical protein B296_00020757 [Ensete ventricosum]|uniref:Uncharacterized protein n=1 Tax=Ensete ventricosum TaxID=4639 RepID=A0A426Z2J3_ENSVE|nr:hypothetical protein B296_00020757 [Ensete ventricosum]
MVDILFFSGFPFRAVPPVLGGTRRRLVSPHRNEATYRLPAWDESMPRLPMQEQGVTSSPRSGYPLFYFYLQDFLNRLVKDHGSIDLEWLKDIEPDQSK